MCYVYAYVHVPHLPLRVVQVLKHLIAKSSKWPHVLLHEEESKNEV